MAGETTFFGLIRTKLLYLKCQIFINRKPTIIGRQFHQVKKHFMGKLNFFEIILILIVLGIMIIPQIFYLITLQKTINEISPENRKMEPNQVWLYLVPIFGLIWQFIMVDNIGISLQAEFQKRNITVKEEKPGYRVGMIYCILFCCTIIPVVGIFAGLVGFIFWIIYWVKINNFKKILAAHT